MLLAILFGANGIYIVAKGRVGPRIINGRRPSTALSWPSRLAAAVLYLVVAAGLMLLVWHLFMTVRLGG